MLIGKPGDDRSPERQTHQRNRLIYLQRRKQLLQLSAEQVEVVFDFRPVGIAAAIQIVAQRPKPDIHQRVKGRIPDIVRH